MYGDLEWMIMLTSFLGLGNGYLPVCVLAAAPKGYNASELDLDIISISSNQILLWANFLYSDTSVLIV